MKLTQKITLIVLSFMVSSLAFAHEGLHAAGQVHAGGYHMGLLEVSIAVIAILSISGYVIKNRK